MNNQLKIYLVLGISIILFGCATPQARMPTVATGSAAEEAKKQQALVVEDYMSSYKRLQKVASKIEVDGAGMCGDKVGSFYGFNFWNQNSFSTAMKESATAKYSLNEHFKILSIAPQSPAEKATFKEGDTIVSINGWLIPIGKDMQKQLNQKLIDAGKTYTPIEIVVLRDNAEQNYRLRQ